MDITDINLTSIYITNIFGVLVATMLLIELKWKILSSAIEKRLLKSLIIIILVSCIVDPLAFTFDGMKVGIAWFIVYFGNLWEFVSNLIIGPLFLCFIVYHVFGTIKKFHRIFILSISGIGIAILIVNLSVPIVYKVDLENCYIRGPVFYIFAVFDGIFICDGVIAYMVARFRGTVVKFFPIWQFIIPLIVGLAIQYSFYGISTVWLALVISISSVLTGLQNESLYHDRLTGMYNRYYFDKVKEAAALRQRSNYLVAMLDINGFKGINDLYGHAEGDEALIVTSKLITKAIGSQGIVIRYAGDEFVILINADAKTKADAIFAKVHEEFEDYNKTSGKEYELTVSCGYDVFDFQIISVDSLLNIIDKKMYLNKKEYYKTHNRRSRSTD